MPNQKESRYSLYSQVQRWTVLWVEGRGAECSYINLGRKGGTTGEGCLNAESGPGGQEALCVIDGPMKA